MRPFFTSKPKIRKGQSWRKKQTGLTIQIIAGHGDKWRSINVEHPNIQHHITRDTLYRFYDLL